MLIPVLSICVLVLLFAGFAVMLMGKSRTLFDVAVLVALILILAGAA